MLELWIKKIKKNKMLSCRLKCVYCPQQTLLMPWTSLTFPPLQLIIYVDSFAALPHWLQGCCSQTSDSQKGLFYFINIKNQTETQRVARWARVATDCRQRRADIKSELTTAGVVWRRLHVVVCLTVVTADRKEWQTGSTCTGPLWLPPCSSLYDWGRKIKK